MAIALSCPSCEHDLKVKDELAGRKVKCPKCAAVIAVEVARVAAKSRAAQGADEDDEEDREEDERPKKKKKKKKAKSKRGLIIGAVIGVVVLVIVLLLFLNKDPAKDQAAQKKVEPAPPEAKGAEAPPPVIEKKDAVGGIARSMERTEIENALRQFGLAYKNFEILHNRGPKDQKELAPYYENNSRMNEFLTNKWIIFIWGVPRNDSGFPNGYSSTILAYEGIADRHDNRFVLFGDGSVHTMNEIEFQFKPKAKGR